MERQCYCFTVHLSVSQTAFCQSLFLFPVVWTFPYLISVYDLCPAFAFVVCLSVCLSVRLSICQSVNGAVSFFWLCFRICYIFSNRSQVYSRKSEYDLLTQIFHWWFNIINNTAWSREHIRNSACLNTWILCVSSMLSEAWTFSESTRHSDTCGKRQNRGESASAHWRMSYVVALRNL